MIDILDNAMPCHAKILYYRTKPTNPNKHAMHFLPLQHIERKNKKVTKTQKHHQLLKLQLFANKFHPSPLHIPSNIS